MQCDTSLSSMLGLSEATNGAGSASLEAHSSSLALGRRSDAATGSMVTVEINHANIDPLVLL